MALERRWVPRGLREHDRADRRRRQEACPARPPSSSWRSPSAPAACRCRGPTTRSPGRSRDENRPIPDGRATEQGPLRVYNYADYIDPVTVKKFEKKFGTSVQIATYNSADEAIAKLAAGAVAFDVIIGLGGVEHRQPDRPEAAAAAEPLLPAEPRQEHLAGAAGSVLRPRQPLHGAVRRLDGRHRLAERQGQGGHRRDGRPLGHLLALAGLPRQGRRAGRQARRASACRSSATRCAPASGPT